MTKPTNLFAKAEAKQQENITNASATSFQQFEETLKILSEETLNAIRSDMKQLEEELRKETRAQFLSASARLAQDFETTAQKTLDEHQARLHANLKQLREMNESIKSSSDHIETLKEQSQTVLYTQKDLLSVSQSAQNTAQQLQRAAQRTGKAQWLLLGLALTLMVVAGFGWAMLIKGISESEKLAELRTQLAQYKDSAALLQQVKDQQQTINEQKTQIIELQAKLDNAPALAQQRAREMERQAQLEQERLKQQQEQADLARQQQEKLAEQQRERQAQLADQIAEQQRKAEADRAKAERDRQRQCEKNPSNRFLCG